MQAGDLAQHLGRFEGDAVVGPAAGQAIFVMKVGREIMNSVRLRILDVVRGGRGAKVDRFEYRL